MQAAPAITGRRSGSAYSSMPTTAMSGSRMKSIGATTIASASREARVGRRLACGRAPGHRSDIASLQAQGAAIDGAPGFGYVLQPGFVLPLDARWLLDGSSLMVGPEADEPPPGKRSAGDAGMPTLRMAIRAEHELALRDRDVQGRETVRTVWPIATPASTYSQMRRTMSRASIGPRGVSSAAPGSDTGFGEVRVKDAATRIGIAPQRFPALAARLALFAVIALTVSGCGALHGARMVIPRLSGLDEVPPNLYVEPSMSAAQRQALQPVMQ
jgi:hypothetical protein